MRSEGREKIWKERKDNHRKQIKEMNGKREKRGNKVRKEGKEGEGKS